MMKGSPGLFNIIGQAWQRGGPGAFFTGNMTDIIRITPQKAIQLAAFDKYKSFFSRKDKITGKKMGPTAFQTSLSGAMAGACQSSIRPLNGRSVPGFNPPPKWQERARVQSSPLMAGAILPLNGRSVPGFSSCSIGDGTRLCLDVNTRPRAQRYCAPECDLTA
eukprot:1182809-Prorocentrum_minimum.AAC.2